MERKALDRKPDLGIRKQFTLPNGTEIAEIGMTVRKQLELTNHKGMTDTERGVHAIAGKILVDGQPIVADDLMDSFTTEELVAITDFLYPDAKTKEEKNG